MPINESILADMTFKEQGLDLGRRVFYFLTTDDPKSNEPVPFDSFPGSLTSAKTAKLLACLIVKLEAKGLLVSPDIDDLLLDTAS